MNHSHEYSFTAGRQHYSAMIATVSLMLVMLTGPAHAQPNQSLVGKQVTVIKWDAPIMRGSETVGTAEVGESFEISKVSGDWLGIEGIGYLKRSDVVPYDKAIDHFSRLIGQDASADNHFDRGLCWDKRGELDKAISDYSEAIRIDSEYADAYNNRGLARRDVGNSDQAMEDFNKAIELDPEYSLAFFNRGLAWYDKGDFDKAVSDYSEAIRLDPGDSLAYYERGYTRYDLGELDAAISDYTESIRIDSEFSDVFLERGLTYLDQGELDKALADFNEAIRLDPGYEYAFLERGLTWFDKGELDKAISDYSEAIRLDPEYADAYNNRGWTRSAQGDYAEAIDDYSEAIRIDPEYAFAYINRAWLLATCPLEGVRNGNQAVLDATKSLELNRLDELEDPNDLDVLAAAYAEVGDFTKAVEWQEKAIELAGDEETKEEWRSRHTLYQSGQPYRLEEVAPSAAEAPE